jgi:hypothetical protein
VPIFTNPAASIPSLEAAVRHTLPDPRVEGPGLQIAHNIILALSETFLPQPSCLLLTDRTNLLQYVTDSKKSPAFLSLLLSCVKQLQHSCQHNPQGVLRAAGMTGMASLFASQAVKLCQTTSSAEAPAVSSGSSSSSTGAAAASSSSVTSGPANCLSSTEATSMSSATAQDSTAASGNHSTNLTAVETASSTVGTGPKAKEAGSAGEDRLSLLWFSAEGTSTVASTWLVLFARVLYTAGAALQALQAAAPGSMSTAFEPLTTPTAAAIVLGNLLSGVQNYAHLVALYMVSDSAAAAVSRRKVKVTLADVAEPVAGAYHAMMGALIAAAQHAEQLDAAAGAGSVIQMESSVTADMRIWQQVLASEHGRQLPQALMLAACYVLPCQLGLAATSPAAAALTSPLSCSLQRARAPSAAAVGWHGTVQQHTRGCTGSSTSQLAELLQQQQRPPRGLWQHQSQQKGL